MPVRQYSTHISQVMAVQFVMDGERNNVQEIALWCQDDFKWEYSDAEKTLKGAIWVGTTPMRIEPGDWILRHADGEFEVLKDKEFRKRFDTEIFNGPSTCQYCLADPAKTPMADGHLKKCPVCGCAYSGGRRSKEYATLVAAGLVNRND